MMKTQIGLGVLSIPQVFDTLGLIPGLICLLTIAGITTWSDWIIGIFKKNHPEVYSISDAGYIMFGRVGREFLGTTYCLCKSPTIEIMSHWLTCFKAGFSSPVLLCLALQSASTLFLPMEHALQSSSPLPLPSDSL
jgi:hypothetical protein